MFRLASEFKFRHFLPLFLFVAFFLSFTEKANAATLSFSPSTASVPAGSTVSVKVVVNTEGVAINNAEAIIQFPSNLLEVVSVSKNSSVFSLWVEEPTFSNSSGTVKFNGGVPNPGFNGSNGSLVSITFRAKAVGNANVRFTSSSVLANDGQGTNVLSGTGQANFSVVKAAEKPAPAPVVEQKETSVPAVQIDELKKKDQTDSFGRFLITGTGKKAKSSYKIEVDGVEAKWENQSSGIFETGALSTGSHNIKVSMETVDNTTVSDTLSFSINGILAPSFTEYSKTVEEGEYIVAKGTADPNTEIIVSISATLDGNSLTSESVTLKSNDKGSFAYVSEKARSGSYEIYAVSRSKSGTLSDKSAVIKIDVSSGSDRIFKLITTAFSTLVPIIALIVLLVILAIWGWYKALHVREGMKKRLAHTKSLVTKSFDILDDDAEEQIKIIKKVKGLHPLTPAERAFVNQFKKDIEAAERVILDDIK